jgi:hypothetical protein
MDKINFGAAAPRIRDISVSVICIALCTFLFISAAGILPPAKVFAASYKESNGFRYEIKAGKAYILDYAGKEPSITIPQKIAGKTVVYVELCDFAGYAVDFSKCKGLKTLYAERLYLNKLDLRANRALKTLSIDESGRTRSLDLSKNTKLTNCLLYIDTLTSLNLSGNKALKRLFILDGAMTKLDLKACRSLTDLTVTNTKLTALSLVKNRSLKRVVLADNKLKSVDIGKNKKLKGLKYS